MNSMNGLLNIGNTCYLNVAIQALLSLKTFPLLLRSIRDRDNPAIVFLQECIRSGTIRKPDSLYDLYLGMNTNKRHMPEDAVECLLRFLHYFEEQTHNTRKRKSLKGCMCHKFWNSIEPFSIVQELFDGIVLVETTCKRCRTKTKHFETFRILPVYSLSNRTVTETIERFVSAIDDIENVKCDHCSEDTSYSVVRSLHRIPPILIFECMDSTASFNLEDTFNITHTHGTEHDILTYKLKNVCLYTGNHYKCISYDKNTASFFMIDDHKIVAVSNDQPNVPIRFLLYENVDV